MANSNEMLELVRNTKTLKGGLQPYLNSEISIRSMHPNEISPTANYVLSDSIARLVRGHDYALKNGFNIFDLSEIHSFMNGYVIAPPVVEYSPDDKSDLLVDGIHRVFLAKLMDTKINVIYIRDVDLSCPFVSYPLTWENVDVVQNRPDVARRIREGVIDRTFHYRDLSFLGSTGPRIINEPIPVSV